MVKIHNVEQGTDEWHFLRLGLPTTSMFKCIITPTGKPSSQAEGYMHQLLGELACSYKDDNHKSWAMQRGNELEPEAAAYYAQATQQSISAVGFVTSDDERIGCSPDRLVEGEGLLEIKCPLQKKHIENLLAFELDSQYKPQVQGQLWLTDRQWCDWMSYHPDIKPMVIRVERDEEYIGVMRELMFAFIEEMDKKIETLSARGVTFRKKLTPVYKSAPFAIKGEAA